MKKLLAIIALSLLWSGNTFAKNGTGDLILHDSVIYNFQKYIKHRKPVKFLVTKDGLNSSSWKCPHSSCVPTGSMNEEALCEKRYGKTCYTFAIGRSIKWQNDQTQDVKGKGKRFSSKDSITEIKTKLTALGFYGSNTVDHNKEIKKPVNSNKNKTKSSWITKKTQTSTNTSNVVSQLEQLNKLYKSGALTKDEFDKAKEKLLN